MKALRIQTRKGWARVARGIPMLQRQRLTVAIQGNSLRLLLLDRQKVLNWAHVPFNPALLRNGFIANPQGISQVLRNALASKGIPPVPAIAALPGFQSTSRVISLPRVKDITPPEVLPREARRLMSFSEKEHYLFWEQVAARPDQDSFLAVAVPRTPLQALVDTIKLAGVPLRRVELGSLALVKAAAQATAIVANVESNSIDIVIAIDSVPVVVRSLWLGDEPLDADSAPRRLSEELVRTISFYNDANPEVRLSPPQPIHLAGGFSIEELAPVVTQETGHPAVAITSAFLVGEGFPAAAMAVNMGLGMGHWVWR